MLIFAIVVILIIAIHIVRILSGPDIAGTGAAIAADVTAPFTTLIVVIVFGMLGELKRVEVHIGRGGGG